MSMIGPHQGQELELMLQGKKPCAVFSDIIPESGFIIEEIIPEKAFAPYVKSGQIIRFEDNHNTHDGHIIKRVIFTLPNETWRADAILWAYNLRHLDINVPFDADDIIIGLLLDYETTDTEEFVQNIQKKKTHCSQR